MGSSPRDAYAPDIRARFGFRSALDTRWTERDLQFGHPRLFWSAEHFSASGGRNRDSRSVDARCRSGFVLPKAVTPDGKGLIFIHAGHAPAAAGDRGDVMLLPLDGDRRPTPL